MLKRKNRDLSVASQADQDVRFFEKLNIEFFIHEIKDPVAVIETALQAMVDHRETYGPLSQLQEATLKRTLRSSKKIRQMLKEMLEIGRVESAVFCKREFELEKIAFETLIEALEIQALTIFEAVEPIRNTKDKLKCLASHGIYFFCDSKIKGLTVIQDEIKFRQIIVNLIKNALYHRDQLVEIRLRLKDGHLILTVEDDGPGVAAEHHQLIFDQYMQIHDMPQMSRCGYGLGLAGARTLARCLGGDIDIRSKKGHGAVFRFSLPITASK
jgi:two-component system OmpR family sensor kinase